MNEYQNKRVIGCLKRRKSLSDFEVNFLRSIKDKPVVSWPTIESEPDALTEKQNHVLNQIAQKVGG